MKLSKDIFCFGCSWTYCYGIPTEQSWPSYLQSKLSEYTVHNLGTPGMDNRHIIHSVFQCIQDSIPEIVILQLTSLDRFAYGVGGFRSFLQEGLDRKEHINYAYHLLRSNQYNYLGSVDNKPAEDVTEIIQSLSLNKEHVDAFLKFHHENITYDLYNQENVLIGIITLIKFLESLGVKVYVFPYAEEGWTDTDEINGIISTSKFSKYLPQTYFFKEPFLKWMISQYGHKHFIDNGFHLSKEGCEILVDQYLLPNIVI